METTKSKKINESPKEKKNTKQEQKKDNYKRQFLLQTQIDKTKTIFGEKNEKNRKKLLI